LRIIDGLSWIPWTVRTEPLQALSCTAATRDLQ